LSADLMPILPTLAVPPQVNNISLLPIDFPTNTVKKYDSTLRSADSAGWDTAVSDNYQTNVVQGFLTTWKLNSLTITAKYGFFETSLLAKSATQYVIFYEGAPFAHTPQLACFSGNYLGDYSCHWDLNSEPPRLVQGAISSLQHSILAFSKGTYAFMISGSTRGQIFDRSILENLAKKVLQKIDVATSLDSFGAELPNLVDQPGILHSLQVKLDNFTKNYQKGEYKTALNNINAFVNELVAQRGKHVSEQAYQTLKGYADTIVQSLNALMQS